MVHQVLSGRKTAHLVPRNGAACPFRPEREYPVLRRRGVAVCRVRVTRVDKTQLDEVEYELVKAAGYGNTDHFRDKWLEEHGTDVDLPLWVIRFVLSADQVRFLARTGGKADYTNNPARAIDDLEAVDDSWLKHFGNTAAPGGAHHASADRLDGLPLATRVARLEQAGGSADVSGDLRVIRSRVIAAERKRGERPR